MAGHGDANHETGAMDISQHRAAYEGFMGYAKWGTVACFVVAAIVVFIIS